MLPAISVRNVSKQYFIGTGAYTAAGSRLTETITNTIRHPILTVKGMVGAKESFWALRDISFDVREGESMGIIGRNGAGKSTMLKILSQITYPTQGDVVLRGRVGSLLEVGTGFHPELTGRENVFLNGAILGMTRKEIRGKFDEIVRFAEVEKFLDTPVKRYSSGMYLRLAFAVAAHLESEILIADEVLAVGDQQFQAKCLGKMKEVYREGRTVIFVSHNMHAVRSLCERDPAEERPDRGDGGRPTKPWESTLVPGGERGVPVRRRTSRSKRWTSCRTAATPTSSMGEGRSTSSSASGCLATWRSCAWACT